VVGSGRASCFGFREGFSLSVGWRKRIGWKEDALGGKKSTRSSFFERHRMLIKECRNSDRLHPMMQDRQRSAGDVTSCPAYGEHDNAALTDLVKVLDKTAGCFHTVKH